MKMQLLVPRMLRQEMIVEIERTGNRAQDLKAAIKEAKKWPKSRDWRTTGEAYGTPKVI